MRRRRSICTTATILVGAVVLAGWGSEDSPQPAAAPAGGGQLTVIETDFELAPADATVPNAGRVKIKAINRGKAPHALTLQTPQGGRSTKTLEPGQAGTVIADVEPGRYTWFCPVANHRQLGMTGTLTVKRAGGDPSPDRKPSAPSAPGGGYGY